tara:strand:- start:216 stop:770 length:555 start_codon:yes stop_codon:yes gene_type:complete
MSDKSNEEKLRILHERLNQIKEKKESTSAPKQSELEQTTTINIDENNHKDKTRKSDFFRQLIYIAIFGILGYFIFYVFNNFNLNEVDGKNQVEEVKIDKVPLKYNLELAGNNIVITGTYTNKDSAEAKVNDLQIRGFKANYFYLPEKSNSLEEVYKVFIGPFENQEETNQWIENIESEFNIIPL